MKSDADKPIDRLLIDITLTLIDEHKGLRGVTLREITRRAGCKHTNLYNYFNSFEDLLWSSLAEAVNQNVNFTNQRMMGSCEPNQLLVEFTESQVEFAVEHPGLYHFIWLDSLNGTPSDDISKVIHSPSQYFYEFIKTTIAADISDREIKQIADITLGYLHGGICKLINGRFFEKTKEEYCHYIVENTTRILTSLIPGDQVIKGGQIR
jgi:AcrR family transcriptional regulator